jgi:hypothetical protein
MSSTVTDRPPAGTARTAIGVLAFLALAGAAAYLAYGYVRSSTVPRPHDFLQVWSAGHLALTGGDPYDGAQMYAVQTSNRMPDTRTAAHPDGYASMMWVPPWGLSVAMALAALPIDLAQLIWGYGQLVLIVACAVVVWRLYDGPVQKQWIAGALALGFGPVWWQTVGGQYAGLLLLGVVGFLAAHRTNRPVLAGAFLALTALKPHLFSLLAIGLLVDALRGPFGRRVVLGGALALAVGALVATIANPAVWRYYFAATGSESPYYPSLAEWFNPTVHAWVRHALPGRPFWVQFVPVALGAPVFAVYWWRFGAPDQWPTAVMWVLPAGLLIAPYGSWPSDQVLFLVPLVAGAAELATRGVPLARFVPALVVFAGASAAVVVMTAAQADLQYYVWLAPVLVGCLLLAGRAAQAAPPLTSAEGNR